VGVAWCGAAAIVLQRPCQLRAHSQRFRGSPTRPPAAPHRAGAPPARAVPGNTPRPPRAPPPARPPAMDLDDLLQQQLGFNPQRSMAQQKAAAAPVRPGSSGGPGGAAAAAASASPRAAPSAGASPLRGAAPPSSAAASSRNASAGSLAGLDDPFASLSAGLAPRAAPMVPSTGSRCARRGAGRVGGGQAAAAPSGRRAEPSRGRQMPQPSLSHAAQGDHQPKRPLPRRRPRRQDARRPVAARVGRGRVAAAAAVAAQRGRGGGGAAATAAGGPARPRHLIRPRLTSGWAPQARGRRGGGAGGGRGRRPFRGV
jgi:hypothetical protein